jgi:predicted naringenin-chalcone synthase
VLTGNNGILTRHLVLQNLEEAFDLTPDALHARFVQNAPLLASEAARRALADSASAAKEIDALIISTCTGYLCPGLTSYVSEQLGLRADLAAYDLVGQGCVAAMPNLSMAASLIASGRYKRVLSICVEVCSAALYFDNDPGVLISACLFGDGASAAVLAPEPGHRRRVQWKVHGSLLCPEDRQLLRFEQKDGRLRNILTPQVPELASRHAAQVLSDVLAKSDICKAQVSGWILHPGGRDVLMALAREFVLGDPDMRWSAAISREYGNLSSASVLFVLQTALADSAPNGYWWMCSFGAGFSCQGALLEVGPP